MMTDSQIAEHNNTAAFLTSEDGIPRLTWQQHGDAFRGPVAEIAPGAAVAAWDSATPGTAIELRDGLWDVTFPDLGDDCRPCRYPASQLRPWPLAGASGH